MEEVDLKSALEVLGRGEILIYPTETCYGLGVDPSQPKALEALLRLKGRDAAKPVSILLPKVSDILALTEKVPGIAHSLMERYLPGPLTVVLHTKRKFPPPISNEAGETGFRVSSHPMARQLMAQWGKALTTTSANPAGRPSGHRVEDLWEYFGGESGVHLWPAGDLSPSRGSTVVRFQGSDLQLLRQGDIALSDLNL